MLEQQDATREADLVPVRHGRTMVSPFTFYRGAAKIMAADLKDTPRAGLTVQLCGDAHLSNFGVLRRPNGRCCSTSTTSTRRSLDRSSTTSSACPPASRSLGGTTAFSRRKIRAATTASVRAYREAMADFAQMGTMDIWYARFSEPDLMKAIKQLTKTGANKAEAKLGKKRAENSSRRRGPATACRRCPNWRRGGRSVRIIDQPPIVVPLRELPELEGVSPTTSHG